MQSSYFGLFAIDFTSKIHLSLWFLNRFGIWGTGMVFLSFQVFSLVMCLFSVLTRRFFVEEEICYTAQYIRAFVKREVT